MATARKKQNRKKRYQIKLGTHRQDIARRYLNPAEGLRKAETGGGSQVREVCSVQGTEKVRAEPGYCPAEHCFFAGVAVLFAPGAMGMASLWMDVFGDTDVAFIVVLNVVRIQGCC